MENLAKFIMEKLNLSQTIKATLVDTMYDEEKFKNQYNVETEKEKQDKLFITRISMICDWVEKITYKSIESFIESFKHDYKLNQYDITFEISWRYNGRKSINITIYDGKIFVGQIVLWSERITLNFAPNDKIEHIIYTLLDEAIERFSKKHYKRK